MRQMLKRVLRRFPTLVLAVALTPVAAATNATAATIFQSGTLGPTGIPRSAVTSGSNVNPFVFVGVRFHLDKAAVTWRIGGHFVRNTGADESFFGAIVALDDENDFPDSGNLSTPDVLGTTLLSFPEPSDEIFGMLTTPLPPGWYSLVFGSGLFGATGNGVALNNGMDIGEPAYVAWQLGSGWFNLSDLSDVVQFNNFRFVIDGAVIPEPSTVTFAIMAVIAALIVRRTRQSRIVSTSV